jgi:hypothetical protein
MPRDGRPVEWPKRRASRQFFAMTEYKPTLFDRHGPDARGILVAWGSGFLICIVTIAVLMLARGFQGWELPFGLVAGIAGGGVGWVLGEGVGGMVRHVAVDGSSTPYERQFSYEQALVMQGRVDDALTSFEAVIAAEPALVAARIKAAELYVKERANHLRAAELFREVSRLPSLTSGDDVYVTNRLVDLYLGPLHDPGRAMVELARLIDRLPRSAAADHARRSLADLKSRLNVESGQET